MSRNKPVQSKELRYTAAAMQANRLSPVREMDGYADGRKVRMRPDAIPIREAGGLCAMGIIVSCQFSANCRLAWTIMTKATLLVAFVFY